MSQKQKTILFRVLIPSALAALFFLGATTLLLAQQPAMPAMRPVAMAPAARRPAPARPMVMRPVARRPAAPAMATMAGSANARSRSDTATSMARLPKSRTSLLGALE